MQIITAIQSQLGVMTWPLSIMSVITLMIILERTLFLSLNSRTKSRALLVKLRALNLSDGKLVESFIAEHLQGKSTFSQGFEMLLLHRNFCKSLREETVNIWLQKKRHSYTSGLRILAIIGVIAPLVGLLGTVIGLIDMFKNLAATQGGIEPALLADGLGLAMSTTAAGLIIALPAITGAQLLNMWADSRLATIENGLNHCNLLIEGVCLKTSKCKKTTATECYPVQEYA
ncbi:biopolymer transporter ExbB [Psychromonas marina]|uniref:Biopolymer transporter ExbB n=1 Tax=Psychromonas marina TaxID=88364 RepID=A0ABQ6E1J0_9GAMM|nr:MotA/TolQ/ExbB proton channel family protein [Psychromonas marina]GLS91070.1 biopolymer transporter ExbB [Psychromonas marina]